MKNFYSTLVVVLSLLTAKVAHAQDIYMRIVTNDNELITANTTNSAAVKDNNATVNVREYVQVSSLQYELEQLANIGPQSSGSGAGKISFKPIVITKLTDESSARLMQLCAKGEPFSIEFIFTTAPTSRQSQVYYKMRSSLALVKTFSASSSGECNGCSGVAESFTFDYGNLQVFTYKTTNTGQIQQNPFKFGWNRLSNNAIN